MGCFSSKTKYKNDQDRNTDEQRTEILINTEDTTKSEFLSNNIDAYIVRDGRISEELNESTIPYQEITMQQTLNGKLFCYHSSITNKSYLVLIPTNPYYYNRYDYHSYFLYKYDVKDKAWSKYECPEQYLLTNDQLETIDEINGKLYIYSSSTFCVFDIENAQWNLIKNMYSRWNIGEIECIFHAKTVENNVLRYSKTPLLCDIEIEETVHDENLENILRETTFHSKSHNVYKYETLTIINKFHQSTKPNQTMFESSWRRKEFIFGSIPEFIEHEYKLLFVKELNRWYIISQTKTNIEVFYSDGFELLIYNKLTGKRRCSREWIQWEDTERNMHHIPDINKSHVIVANYKMILLFHWESGWIFCFQLGIERIVKHRKTLDTVFSKTQYVAYDSGNNDVYFSSTPSIIDTIYNTIKVVKMKDLFPTEFYKTEIINGYIRECEQEYNIYLPHALYHVIGSYFI